MAKAKAAGKERLVERVVVGPKTIWAQDPKTGERFEAKIGDTVKLPLRTANTFARYLAAPEVVKAEAAVKKAEADAADEAAPDEGGDSDES